MAFAGSVKQQNVISRN